MSALATTADAAPAPGLPAQTRDTQRVFRALLTAFSFPATEQPLSLESFAPPAPLGATTAAVLLTLCDESTPLWLDPAYRTRQTEAWLAFHSGVRTTNDLASAAFVAAAPESCPPLAELATGTDADPHTSATLILAASRAPAGSFRVCGPGIRTPRSWDAMGISAHFVSQWAANNDRFPAGIDLVLAYDTAIVALPRTTRVKKASEACT